ncbi:hypothetical protein JCM3775_003207 [Rhodotorula graminis]|uniref:Uncharacterized protein n=1 Tax=Rhodotorula graminis (strain WP1) TaxID=578459 RepID=A0A194S982_RHOGW|nr:uncharacterized protein RHOBADRAFT_42370 [Rhodotorula graminis WP1]KPV77157.1 hypothetical protein RHOBADRAFT_42370 [Rhodotorula graminis WP1]
MFLPRSLLVLVVVAFAQHALAAPAAPRLERRQANSLTSIQSTSQVAASTGPSTAPAATPTVSESVTGTASVPFFSAPDTFTPTATGSSAVPGSLITITNGPYTSDVFTYTAAASTVPPTGNITNPGVAASAGGAGGNTDLGASPTNLQIAGATTTRSLASTGALGVALIASLGLLVG